MEEDAVREMIASLPDTTTVLLLESMSVVEGVFSWPDTAGPRIREIRSGNVGWLINRHGEFCAASEGFDVTFEALDARIMADFIENRR